MKIAIVGGGWIGCHIANKLKEDHDITLFEKTQIFSGSSLINQNRLHKGFHYSRNSKTRRLCSETFQLFINDYSNIVENVSKNFYAIPVNKSLIDYQTYISIFRADNIEFDEVEVNCLSNIEGIINVEEKYINPFKAKQYFTEQLKDCVVYKEITVKDLEELSKEYDLVVDATNNSITLTNNHYYELSLVLIYEKVIPTNFDALTLVDGPLFSIYPYLDSKYTITDVEFTPLHTERYLSNLLDYRDSLQTNYIFKLRDQIESKIEKYYNSFTLDFKYIDYNTAIKVKKVSESADRSPTIEKQGNIITCSTGKIQGIYQILNYINNEITYR